MNKYIEDRIKAIQNMLMQVHEGGRPLSDASRGVEREAFINAFLSDILTPQFRFGSGEITDQKGNRSGQLDIVIEFPFVPSLPLISGKSPRLYLAEGIVAVIEVKSDIKKQWDEVFKTAEKLSQLKRNYSTGITIGPIPAEKIPLYAVGYKGWKNIC